MARNQKTMDPKSSTVAFIHPDLGIGGAERLIIDMANALDDYQIIFLVNHYDPNHCFDDLKERNYKINVFGDWIPGSIFGRCRALLAYIKMIYLVLIYLIFYRAVYQVDFHIVDLIPIAIPFLKLFNQKVLYYCHHPDLLATTRESTLKKLYRLPIDWLECKATSFSDIILVNSEYTASVFRKTFPHIEKQLRVLYPTISTSVMELLKSSNLTVSKEEILGLSNDSIVFMSINRFHPAKKLELAIEAMGQLKKIICDQEKKEIYLVMVGGYDPNSIINMTYFEQLQEKKKELDLNNVIFLKSPSEMKKVQLLHVCDCLLYTPVNEHFGIVPLEAMMAKKPVIACNSGGPKETIIDGFNGYLCEPNAISLAECMHTLVKSKNLKEMGKNGFKRLNECFSNKLFQKKLNGIVSEALKG